MHITRTRVRYGETDQMGLVHHANFFHYFELSRTEMIRDLGSRRRHEATLPAANGHDDLGKTTAPTTTLSRRRRSVQASCTEDSSTKDPSVQTADLYKSLFRRVQLTCTETPRQTANVLRGADLPESLRLFA